MKPRRILVLQPAFLGDVVFASPLTRALSEGFPGAELAVLVRPPAEAIARHLPGVGKVICYDKLGAARGIRGLRAAGRAVKAFAPDLVVSLHASPRTAVLAMLSGAPERLGPAEGLAAGCYTRTLRLAGLPYARRATTLAEALGLSASCALELRLPAPLLEWGRCAVPPRAVAVVAGSEWETKRWPIEHAAALALELRARGFSPVLLGSPSERALCAALNRLAGGSCLDLCGNPVQEALAILSACSAAVGGDSGLLHAARALGIGNVLLFGPTSAAAHLAGPRDRFLSLALACSPCSAHGSRRCPLDHHRCLRDLGPDRVLRVLQELS